MSETQRLPEEAGVADAVPAETIRWQRMFGLSQDLFCVIGTDGFFKQLNPAWEELFGLTTEELKSAPYIELLHPDDREAARADADKLGLPAPAAADSAAVVSTVRFENRFRHKDGSYSWLDWTATYDADSGLIYAVARDVSERKRQEQTLTDLNRAAMSMSGVADPAVLGDIVVRRAIGLLNGDTSTLCWLDTEQQELVSLADSQAGTGLPTTRQLGEGVLGIAARDAKAVAIDDYPSWPGALALGGERMPASVLAVPLMSGRTVIGSLAVAFHTRRQLGGLEVQVLSLLAAQAAPALEQAKLFEQLRAANQQLSEASQVKSKFLAGMSHELRTPLNAILGFSELLIDNPAEDLQTRQEYLNTIHASGKHLLSLINDLLDVAKIEAGKMDVQAEELDVYPVVSEVVASLRSLATAKGIPIQIDVASGLLVRCDGRHLRQILINLLSNAFKFTPVGGAIKVAGSLVNHQVSLRVSDTGIGIAPEHLAGIFDQFTQVRNSTTRSQQGTGLGLALTQGLVELNGGRIEVASQLGKGSTFTVHLPNGAPSAAGGPEKVDTGRANRPHVLVVEDDPAAADLLERHLNQAGYQTARARRGVEAIEMATRLRPLAITLDLLLPDMDGWDVLRLLKTKPATRRIPVVVVSVVDDPYRALALGAVDFQLKPVQPRVLVDCVGKLLRLGHPTQARLRVLAIDDDPTDLAITRRILERAGYDTVTATGGREGVEIARLGSPDIVVVDLLMPGMDGFEVIAQLRSEASTQETPILVLTAKELSREEKAYLTGHVAAILTKARPSSVDLLGWVRAIEASLAENRSDEA